MVGVVRATGVEPSDDDPVLVAIMVGVVPWNELSENTPVSQVAEIAFFGPLSLVGVGLITFAALLATASSANASILSSARINFAM
jgi:amino acid transporter